MTTGMIQCQLPGIRSQKLPQNLRLSQGETMNGTNHLN